MAQLITFPNSAHGGSWPSVADTLPAMRDGQGGFSALLAALDTLLDELSIAWWDGSSLSLSRGGLETLVGLEPGDATPPRRPAVEPRGKVWA